MLSYQFVSGAEVNGGHRTAMLGHRAALIAILTAQTAMSDDKIYMYM